MTIDYRLTGAGWATATIATSGQRVEMTVSYLHDSLKQLAEAGIQLGSGASNATVVFMDEPGEHQMLLESTPPDHLSLEIRWFDDWNSWDMHPADQYTVVLQARVLLEEFRQSVITAMREILDTWGVAGYKSEWGEHDFPGVEYDRLRAS